MNHYTFTLGNVVIYFTGTFHQAVQYQQEKLNGYYTLRHGFYYGGEEDDTCYGTPTISVVTWRDYS